MSSGTSLASPHVAALAALVLSRHSQKAEAWLTSDEVRALIAHHARKVGCGGQIRYGQQTNRPHGLWHEEMGYGLIDIKATLDAI